MAQIPQEPADLFPSLEEAQIARLAVFGEARTVQKGEIVFDLGSADHGVFVVLEGSLEVIGVSNGVESVLSIVGRGAFTGDVSQLSGRRSLVRCRAHEASSLIEISRANLRRILQTDAAIGEVFLRVFLLRRLFLISHHVGRPSHSGSIRHSRDGHSGGDLPWHAGASKSQQRGCC